MHTEQRLCKNLIKANEANAIRHAAIQRAFVVCAQCGAKSFCKPREVNLRRYCSKECEAQHYKVRLRGSANPNFKNAGKRTCEQCGNEYKSYNKTRRFCSKTCYGLKYEGDAALRAVRAAKLSAAGKRPRKPRVRNQVIYPLCPMCGLNRLPNGKARTRTCGAAQCIKQSYKVFWDSQPSTASIPAHKCIQCHKEFCRYGATSLFCSYQCFVANGGPFRAGLAAAKMTKKYGAKKDANHQDVFKVMREMGVGVYDLSAVGCGVPDGIAWIAKGWRMFEVKNPNTGYGKRGLNPIQKKWLSQWNGGPVYIIRSVDQAILFAQGKLEQTECITPEQCAADLLKAG